MSCVHGREKSVNIDAVELDVRREWMSGTRSEEQLCIRKGKIGCGSGDNDDT